LTLFSPRVAMTMCLISVLPFLAALPAQAQMQQPTKKVIRIKAQFGKPQSGETRDVLGTKVLGLSVGFDTPGSGSTTITNTIDYAGKSDTKDETRVDLQYFALTSEVRYFIGTDGRATPGSYGLYAGGGAGLYYLRYKRQLSGVVQENTNGLKFGAKVLAGFQTSSRLYVEAEYTFPGSSGANMFFIGVGLRLSPK
jgi:hypothetical protein